MKNRFSGCLMNGRCSEVTMRAKVILGILLLSVFTPVAQAQQPDITQEHWYHSYLTLTNDLQAWAADYPEIVMLTTAGTTVLGRQQWVVQISDWSNEMKPDGTSKEKVYIDGGHHGNEHLGTELAFLTAEFYIEGWNDGIPEAIEVLQNTELHIMVLLNADGNDIDNRWNMNAVDLNRNYDHHWTSEETRSGDGPFSEPETRNNADYMAAFVTEADLYVTMHTGTWILAYPWGFTGEMPSDWELFEHIRDTIHETIDPDLPVRNANAGIYPTHGTSRDYGYGIMGFPTFTFETDDEQFLLGTVEALSDRLSVELEVMRYLITNVSDWRARLHLHDLVIDEDSVSATVVNTARASTSNATLWWLPDGTDTTNLSVTNELNDENRTFTLSSDDAIMIGDFFAVNATNSTNISFKNPQGVSEEGVFVLVYQKRVIDSSMAVVETVHNDEISFASPDDGNWLGGWGIFDPTGFLITLLAAAWWVSRRSL